VECGAKSESGKKIRRKRGRGKEEKTSSSTSTSVASIKGYREVPAYSSLN